MTLTKSQAAERVRDGRSVETFHHATMGVFNVTACRQIIKRMPHIFKPHHVRFADIKAEGLPDLDSAGVVAWLVGQREVDQARCAELTSAQLEDPLISMMDEAGMSYVIDGIHRLSERFRRGKTGYRFYAMPVQIIPKLAPGTYLERPWGEMDVRDGQLVKRK
jgi:hypothetical protein